jgi:hypothetical protein
MLGDAKRLFEVREPAIVVLAGRRMPTADAEGWAAALDICGMQRKPHELDVRVAEIDGAVVGWGGIQLVLPFIIDGTRPHSHH